MPKGIDKFREMNGEDLTLVRSYQVPKIFQFQFRRKKDGTVFAVKAEAFLRQRKTGIVPEVDVTIRKVG
jgi:hypothetical protein